MVEKRIEELLDRAEASFDMADDVEVLDEESRKNHSQLMNDGNAYIKSASELLKVENERKSQEEELEYKRKASIREMFTDVVKVTVPIGIAIGTTIHETKLAQKLIEFEKTGILGSSASRNFFSNVLRRRK